MGRELPQLAKHTNRLGESNIQAPYVFFRGEAHAGHEVGIEDLVEVFLSKVLGPLAHVGATVVHQDVQLFPGQLGQEILQVDAAFELALVGYGLIVNSSLWDNLGVAF